MTQIYHALSIANLLLYGFCTAGVLVIVWIGWLRTRQVAYLVLAAWALSVMAGAALSYLPWFLSVSGLGGQTSTTHVVMWMNLARTVLSSALLLLGLGLLVFGRPRLGGVPAGNLPD